jgi:hypothetical protein
MQGLVCGLAEPCSELWGLNKQGGAGVLSASFWRVSMASVLNGRTHLTSNSRHDAAHA